jgi:RNA polymerase subunit RPABC4/transcription elongation factor Spt4
MVAKLITPTTSKQCPKCNSFSLRKHHSQVYDARKFICRNCNSAVWYSDDWEEYIARINHLLEEFPISESERNFLEEIRLTTTLHWHERIELLCIEYRMQYESPHIKNLIEEQSDILMNRMIWNG